MRRAALDTPSATMLGVDYHLSATDVDRDRIVLVGGKPRRSLRTRCAAADDRITALALLFGAGDLFAMIDANLPLPSLVRRPMAWVLSVVVSPLEPLKYIERVAPSAGLHADSTGDPRMPGPLQADFYNGRGSEGPCDGSTRSRERPEQKFS